MNPSARLQATLELLTEIDSVLRPADAITSAYFRARRYIGSKDRAAIATMTYDILRHHARLGWWMEKIEAEKTPRNRLLTYMALVKENKLKDIGEMFSGGKYAPPKLEDSERVFLRQLDGHTIEHPSMPDEVKAECPPWAAGPLKERFGKNFSREMKALLKPAALDLRINPLKTARDDILDELGKTRYQGRSLSNYRLTVFASKSALRSARCRC